MVKASRKPVSVTLTPAEVNQIISLIQWNRQEVTYYGARKQYEQRADAIEAKLTAAIKDTP